MRLILSVPLFLYILLAANIIMWSGTEQTSPLNIIILEFTLPSTRAIIITVSDLFILSCFLALYIETFKATRTSNHVLIDHALSLCVFVVALIELMIFPRLGNTTFLVITVAALLDVIMGFTVTLSAARRDISFGG